MSFQLLETYRGWDHILHRGPGEDWPVLACSLRCVCGGGGGKAGGGAVSLSCLNHQGKWWRVIPQPTKKNPQGGLEKGFIGPILSAPEWSGGGGLWGHFLNLWICWFSNKKFKRSGFGWNDPKQRWRWRYVWAPLSLPTMREIGCRSLSKSGINWVPQHIWDRW